jgi:two-component system nitrogen regulation sensor histidine kinase GlnL
MKTDLIPPPGKALTRRRKPLAPDGDRWLEALALAVFGVDREGRIEFANPAAMELFGSGGARLVGRRLEDVFGPGCRLASLCADALQKGLSVTAGLVSLHPKGLGEVSADVTAAPLDDGHYVAISIAPRSRAHGLAASGLSAGARALAHEVRNPLAGIRGAAQLIGKGAPPETAELAQLICAESDRIRRLTDRIDALEGLAPPNLATLNVHEAMDRVKMLVGRAFPEVRLKERFDPSLPPILGDLDQLIQAFLNIAKNAAEACRSRGDATVVLSTGYVPGFKVRASLAGPARPQLEASFEDNGPGLPAALSDRVFEPFLTTKKGGMGLGLALSSAIIAAHEGRIDVESAPGRTVFRVLLPLADGGVR